MADEFNRHDYDSCNSENKAINKKPKRQESVSSGEYIARFRSVHGDRYEYINIIRMPDGRNRAVIVCRLHGEFEQRCDLHLVGKGCPSCGKASRLKKVSLSQEEFNDKARSLHGEQYDYILAQYINTRSKVEIICRDHGVFKQSPAQHLIGKGCPECGNRRIGDSKRSNKELFISRARKRHGDLYNYSKVEYVSYLTEVTIICREHGSFNVTPTSHLSGCGCPDCGESRRRQKIGDSLRHGADGFIEASKKVHGDIYGYGGVNYINARTKVEICCHKHGSFWQEPHVHLRGAGCPTCKEPMGERAVAKWLKSERLSFQRQAKFHGLRNLGQLRFDFFVPLLRWLIEFDGRQHFDAHDYFGGDAAMKQRKVHDAIKNNYARLNGYHLTRIRYDQDVEKVLKRKLRQIQSKLSEDESLPLLARA